MQYSLLPSGSGIPAPGQQQQQQKASAPRSGNSLKLAAIVAMAFLHLFIVVSMASRYYMPLTSTTVISVNYTGPQAAARMSNGEKLLRAIAEMKEGELGPDALFRTLPGEEIADSLESYMVADDFNPMETLGIDKQAFCKLAALKLNTGNNSSPNIVFHEPRVGVVANGVVLTTYFNSRVDPLRCYKHAGGRIEQDSFRYMEHWYLSVQALGLHAVVFHESLSDEYVARVQTERIRFQRVSLSHYAWSLCDERWAVYQEWLEGPGVEVGHVLQVDISDTVVAKDPFALFARRAAEYDLWVNVQKNTPWVIQNYGECYSANQSSLLASPSDPAAALVYNAGVVGGKRDAFLALAHALTSEFDSMYADPEKPIWNCDMSALHFTLTSQKFLSSHRVFNSGSPFCAGGIKCWRHGECKFYIYHK